VEPVVDVATSVNIIVRHYEKRDAKAWDRLVGESWSGTFLHERRFLAYHGDRFADLSLVVEDDRGYIVGVFPAALDPAQGDVVTSHPGSTYGGVVHSEALRGIAMLEALRAIATTYS